jgi:ABC-type nitrate/sulfonate/bicarbonate transport system ATPase subunit
VYLVALTVDWAESVQGVAEMLQPVRQELRRATVLEQQHEVAVICPITPNAHLERNQSWLSRMLSSGMRSRVPLVRTGVSEEGIASIISVKRISEVGTT